MSSSWSWKIAAGDSHAAVRIDPPLRVRFAIQQREIHGALLWRLHLKARAYGFRTRTARDSWARNALGGALLPVDRGRVSRTCGAALI